MKIVEKQGTALYSGKILQVTAEDGAILNWDSFSIQAEETTQFILPSSSSAVLNRVLGNSISEINGTLESNGSIALINPNGILFGQDSRVHLANLIASTFDLSNEDFFNGKFVFRADSDAKVINEGRIETDGYILLVGKTIENFGTLKADSVFLAAGSQIVFDPRGQQRLVVSHEHGNTPYESAIRLEGTVKSLDELFVDTGSGLLQVEAQLSNNGGEIRLLAEEIHIGLQSRIDASTDSKGGTVLIGGDYKGKNPSIPNAKRVWIGKDANIISDANINGDGGKVIVWGDEACVFTGTISAQGGTNCGNGGFVETSSPGYLEAAGVVSTLAPNGKTGTYLLDPCAVTINSTPTTALGVCPSWNFTGLATANILNTSLQTCLASNSVVIDAVSTGTNPNASILITNNVQWNSAVNSLTLNANPGTVTVRDAIVRSQGGAPITINATTTTIQSTGITSAQIRQDVANAITINSDLNILGGNGSAAQAFAVLDANNATTVTINGNVTMQAGSSFAFNAYSQIQSNGNVTINGNVDLFGGAANGPATGDAFAEITLNGAASLTINGNYNATGGTTLGIGTIASGRVLTQGGDLTINGNVNALGGNALVDSRSSAGVEMATYGPGGGDIIINGNVTLTGGTASNGGIAIANVQTESGGNIHINGDMLLTGGNAITAVTPLEPTSARAVTSSRTGGSTFITGNSITLVGGTGLGGSDAQIHSANGIGNININLTGPITATGNPTAPSGSHKGYIRCLVGGNIDITCSQMDFNAGLSPDAEALVRTNLGNIAINTGNMNFIARGANASIDTEILGGNILVNANQILLQGGDSLDGSSQIHAAVNGNIDISCGSVTMQGGTSAGTNTESRIFTDTGNISINSTGPVSINAGNHFGSQAHVSAANAGAITINGSFFELNAGSAAGASGFLATPSGDIFIHSSSDANLNATLAGSPARIETLGGTLTLTAEDNISTNGFSYMSTTGGSLLGIAGNNFFVDAPASIFVQTIGDLTLVCDNDFPTAPSFGTGSFTLVSGGTIQNLGGGAVRIFTALPTLNSFPNPAVINGVAFSLTTTLTFIDVPPYEYWCIYYDPTAGAIPPFSGSSIGGFEFTVFYKPCFQNLTQSIVAQQELLFDLNTFDTYFDEFYTQFEFNYLQYLPYIAGSSLPDIQGYTFRRKLYFENVGRNPEPEMLNDMPFIAQEEIINIDNRITSRL